MGGDRVDERAQQPGRLADPVGHRRPVEVDALAGVNLRLTVQRQVIAIFGDQHMTEPPGAGPAAVDGQARHRRLRHRLAAPAGKRRADVADHLEPAGDVVQRLGDVLAHLAHRPAAGRTDARRRVHDIGARQMLRQRTATAPALRLRHHGRRRGSLLVWAFARRLCFQLFQRQLQLADHLPELLRRPAEGLPAQPGDLQLQRLDLQRLGDQAGPRRRELGRLGYDQRPQRLGIIRKGGTLDRHSSFIAYREDTRY